MISFTSSIPLSIEKTPLTLDWAEENYELFSQGMLFKSFAIVKQTDCFLSWNMDEEGNEWWKLSIHYATFDVEFVQEVEFLMRTFGIENDNDKQHEEHRR